MLRPFSSKSQDMTSNDFWVLSMASASTLDIIARYLGFSTWVELRIYDDKSNSSFESISDEIRVQELTAGQQIQISYLPDRQLVLEYQGDNSFRILSSKQQRRDCQEQQPIRLG